MTVKTESNTDMPMRTLGRTGVRVSLIGLGGWHLGFKSIDEQLSVRIIRTAIDNGINFMDNCWDYNEGASELRMGKALRDGYRERDELIGIVALGLFADRAIAVAEQRHQRCEEDQRRGDETEQRRLGPGEAQMKERNVGEQDGKQHKAPRHPGLPDRRLARLRHRSRFASSLRRSAFNLMKPAASFWS